MYTLLKRIVHYLEPNGSVLHSFGPLDGLFLRLLVLLLSPKAFALKGDKHRKEHSWDDMLWLIMQQPTVQLNIQHSRPHGEKGNSQPENCAFRRNTAACCTQQTQCASRIYPQAEKSRKIFGVDELNPQSQVDECRLHMIINGIDVDWQSPKR